MAVLKINCNRYRFFISPARYQRQSPYLAQQVMMRVRIIEGQERRSSCVAGVYF
jgi:hypothetical protein